MAYLGYLGSENDLVFILDISKRRRLLTKTTFVKVKVLKKKYQIFISYFIQLTAKLAEDLQSRSIMSFNREDRLYYKLLLVYPYNDCLSTPCSSSKRVGALPLKRFECDDPIRRRGVPSVSTVLVKTTVCRSGPVRH